MRTLTERNDAIVQMVRDGHTHPQIAEVFGLSPQRVWEIAKRGGASGLLSPREKAIRAWQTRRVDVARRFWPYVNCEGECWLWTGGKSLEGYGHFSVNNRTVGAHRFAYEQFHGPIPAGLQLDHLCRNPSCVKPDHLEPVTPAENQRRQPRYQGRSAQDA